MEEVRDGGWEEVVTLFEILGWQFPSDSGGEGKSIFDKINSLKITEGHCSEDSAVKWMLKVLLAFSSWHMEKLTLGRIRDPDTWKPLAGLSASIDKLKVQEAHWSSAATVKQAVKMLHDFIDNWRMETLQLDFKVGINTWRLLLTLVKSGAERLQALRIKEAMCENKETSELMMLVLSNCPSWQVEKLTLKVSNEK